VLQRHLDAIAATLQLAQAQIEAARHALTLHVEQPAPERPERCVGTPDEQCALKDDSAKRALMGGAFACTGCGAQLTQ
jgi:hypothetical protein